MATSQQDRPVTQLHQELQEFFIDRQARNLTPKTLHWYTHNLTLFAEYTVKHGIKATVDITPRHVRRFLIYLSEHNYNAGDVYAVFGALRAYLRWFAVEYEPSNWTNPLNKVEAPKRPKELKPPINLDDFKSILATCESKTFIGDRDRAMLLFLLDTGVRHQELTDLQIGDVDLNTDQVIIKRGKGRKDAWYSLAQRHGGHCLATFAITKSVRMIFRYGLAKKVRLWPRVVLGKLSEGAPGRWGYVSPACMNFDAPLRLTTCAMVATWPHCGA